MATDIGTYVISSSIFAKHGCVEESEAISERVSLRLEGWRLVWEMEFSSLLLPLIVEDHVLHLCAKARKSDSRNVTFLG